MNILVIKQTSLGDVLHATGHVRAIKQHFPGCRLTLLTADTSRPIFADNPHVDEIISFQRYRVKKDWWRRPLWTLSHFAQTLRAVRRERFDLAVDLQGRWKSVLFLYAASAKRRYVKGNWPFLAGFRDRNLHALREMDRVLELAGIPAIDTHMEFFVSTEAQAAAAARARAHGWREAPYIVISPFTRWPSKNWSPGRYAELLAGLPPKVQVLVTGAEEDRSRAEALITASRSQDVVNLCGALDLAEFAAVVGKALAVVSGDSFAMHLAAACGTPVVALFGPTAESRVGPGNDNAVCLRADVGCTICYRRNCPRRCIDGIAPGEVIGALRSLTGIGEEIN